MDLITVDKLTTCNIALKFTFFHMVLVDIYQTYMIALDSLVVLLIM